MRAEPDWSSLRAPDLARFEAMAHDAYERLPDGFRERCAGVTIRVAELPDDEMLDELGLESPFDLLGLFRGIGLAQGGDPALLQTGQMPNMIWLFRRPLLDYWAEHEETLGHLVTHVLVHELGHHFGLSDDDMARIEAEAGDADESDRPRSDS